MICCAPRFAGISGKKSADHPERAMVAQRIIDDLVERIAVMLDLGLRYLSLERSTPTVSPGELQRLRLATQIRSNLFGVVYVLDEPSAGLHPADTEALHVVACGDFAMAARHVNCPVKLVVRRPQMFGPVGCRSETRQTIAIGATKEGRLVSLANDTLSHTSRMDEFHRDRDAAHTHAVFGAEQPHRPTACAVRYRHPLLYAGSGRSSRNTRARSGNG
jgi:hypothetical protein